MGVGTTNSSSYEIASQRKKRKRRKREKKTEGLIAPVGRLFRQMDQVEDSSSVSISRACVFRQLQTLLCTVFACDFILCSCVYTDTETAYHRRLFLFPGDPLEIIVVLQPSVDVVLMDMNDGYE